MIRPRLTIASLAAASLLAAPVSAQDKAPPPREFAGDLGFVNVSGNTSVTTLNAGERLVVRAKPWEFKQDFGTVYGKTDGKESSNLLRASVRGDYGPGGPLAFYVRTAFDRDKFAGVKSRFAEGVGLLDKLIANAKDQLNIEAGFELTQQQDYGHPSVCNPGGGGCTPAIPANKNFSALRGAASWKHSFTKTAYFFQGAEALPNLDDHKDLRVNTETTVVAPLSTHVGIKFSYVVRFDNEPPLNAAGTAPLRKSDRLLTSGVQISF